MISKRRHVEPPVPFKPFYSKGNTCRNELRLDKAGWYFIDDRKVLSGPYATKLDCEFIMGAMP